MLSGAGLLDYKILSAGRHAEVDVILVEQPDPVGPYGLRPVAD